MAGEACQMQTVTVPLITILTRCGFLVGKVRPTTFADFQLVECDTIRPTERQQRGELCTHANSRIKKGANDIVNGRQERDAQSLVRTWSRETNKNVRVQHMACIRDTYVQRI